MVNVHVDPQSSDPKIGTGDVVTDGNNIVLITEYPSKENVYFTGVVLKDLTNSGKQAISYKYFQKELYTKFKGTITLECY